jgi:predicted DNA-binding protein YlxM (UPF0122 family)
LDIIKSYSDNIEKDFYLKEISKLLDISSKIVYDSFNRVRFSTKNKEAENQISQVTGSEDLAI